MEASTSLAPRGIGRTSRRDAWWIRPLLVVVGLTAFTIYSVWAIAVGADYLYEEDGAQYLSPFYSPNLDELLGLDPPFSFAFLVVWAPLGLRLTCYYYRKAYYRAFFLAPPACGVSGPRRRRYRGETGVFVLQNLHRYFFYAATIVLAFLWFDAGRAFVFDGELGVGLGSLVLATNVLLLSLFTFGCNSFRHLVGGRLDCLGCSRARHQAWLGVSVLNRNHAEWAWISLVGVALADLYVRLAAMGVFDDPRII